MKAHKVRDLDSAELRSKLAESEEQLFRLRFQLGMGQTDGVKKFRELRRDRARMLTILRERESEGAPRQAAETPAGKKKGK
ncbi:MAG: 50S ribosomal protein L29 [Acidobacteria bacterium]|nr:50S ribosomal protein L29 [Acidobacteriota bacterium]MBI3280389.1 50S ribosomal protein L29 [Acidobacteriota bacterium]